MVVTLISVEVSEYVCGCDESYPLAPSLRYTTIAALSTITLLVNPRRLARRAGKLDQMSRGLSPPVAKHLGSTSDKHLFDLEPTL